ncbi:MAG: hypothetical protein LUH10_00445 [Tannerellaceae bacterium]|nr:hypothetical protein [Tannerellaceae bacterium]
MKKNLLLILFTLPLVYISCTNSVEIIVKDTDGRPFIGADVYITTEDISHLKSYLKANEQYEEQTSLRLDFITRKGYSSEKAEEAVKDYYMKEGLEYRTTHQLFEHQEKHSEEINKINWNVKSRTNSLGTINCNLKDGNYNIYILESTYGLAPIKHYSGSFYVFEDVTKVFTLRSIIGDYP